MSIAITVGMTTALYSSLFTWNLHHGARMVDSSLFTWNLHHLGNEKADYNCSQVQYFLDDLKVEFSFYTYLF
jgi:hypothetical protein